MKKINLKTLVFDYFSFIGLLLILIAFEILTEGRLLSSRNLMNIFNNFFIISLGAVGVLFLMSFKEIDLSVGAILGLSAALAAMAGGENLLLIFPIAIVTGLVIGCFNGLLIAKLKVESFIGTLAVSFVARGFMVLLLNGSVGIPTEMRKFDQDIIKIPVFLIVMLFFYVLFEFTAFGKSCRAIGASEDAARQSGIRVEKIKMAAFAISGFLCGLAAFFSLVRTTTASSKTGDAFEFEVLLAVLLGGLPLSGGWGSKFRAAVVGSISMAIMQNGMSLMGIDGLTQQVVQGVILIIVVVISFDRRNVSVIK
ncbi:MAG: ABC transporter permease [Lachnospiraceae bacterium]